MNRARRSQAVDVSHALKAGLLVLAIVLVLSPRAAVADELDRQAFVASVNRARASHGMRLLRPSAGLQQSSRAYAYWMLEYQSFRHLPTIRVSRRFGLRGEVLARTPEEFPTAEKIVHEWLLSPSHRAVLLNPRFRYIGIGVVGGWLGDEPVTLIAGHFGGAVRGRRPKSDGSSSTRHR